MDFTITKLPDDPRLSPQAAARRTRKSGKLHAKHRAARSVTKPHQHHHVALKPRGAQS